MFVLWKKHSEENLKFFSDSQKNKPNKAFMKSTGLLNINYLTIRYRLNSNSKNFTNYHYIKDEELIIKLKNEYINQEFI